MKTDSNGKGNRECVSVEFKPAKGGVVSESRFETKRGGQGGGPMMDYDHETAVHPTEESAHEHLGKMLGQHFEGADRDTPADKE